MIPGAVEGLASAAKGGLEGIVNGVEGLATREAEEIGAESAFPGCFGSRRGGSSEHLQGPATRNG